MIAKLVDCTIETVEEEIEKIWGGNLIRVFKEVQKVASEG